MHRSNILCPILSPAPVANTYPTLHQIIHSGTFRTLSTLSLLLHSLSYSLILIYMYNTYHYGLLVPLYYSLHVCVVQIQSLGKDNYFPPIFHRCLHHLLQLLSHFSHWCLLFPPYLLVCILQVLSAKKHHLQRENALDLNAILTRFCILYTCTHGG